MRASIFTGSILAGAAALALMTGAALADGPPETPSIREQLKPVPPAPKPPVAQPAPAPKPAPAPVVAPKPAPTPTPAPVAAPPAPAPAATPVVIPPPAATPAPTPVVTPAPVTPPAATPPVTTAATQTGMIPLGNGALTLNVPTNYAFYPAADARTYLSRIGKRPTNGDEVLGMIAPAGRQVLAADFWASVVTFNRTGWVGKDGAERISTPAFKEQVKQARSPTVLEEMEVAPTFDAATNTLTWSEQYRPVGPLDRNVVHEQRILGREGVIGFTTYGEVTQLAEIKGRAKELAMMANFPAGRGYANIVQTSDKASPFDIPGLITGLRRTTSPVVAGAAGAGDVRIPTPATAAAPEAANVLGPVPSWFPWAAGAIVGVPLLLWLMFGRNGARRSRVPSGDLIRERPTQNGGSGGGSNNSKGLDFNISPPKG